MKAEVLENGINVGEMNALLLQKIEELALYVVGLEKKRNENRQLELSLNCGVTLSKFLNKRFHIKKFSYFCSPYFGNEDKLS
ncbi:MAG: hypothetical protein B6D61_07940 [Bacteroidetes bacterium 4484_249]|nr:MAG: hypothetical protein B6D61_07940 [Bacteroidetes bacterium 4484_249]